MENTAIPDTNWKEIGTTAGIVLVVGFVATLAAMAAYDGIKKMAAKKPSKDKEKEQSKS